MSSRKIILGAGVTGLSAGLDTDYAVFEAESNPGGIVASYYVGADGVSHPRRVDDETYRFELGGGHWIFGGNPELLQFLHGFCTTRAYERRSAVYFPDRDAYVPYPIQNNLAHLPDDVRKRVLGEILDGAPVEGDTLRDWLLRHFGPTLCEIFFFPFHELYTAGLYPEIAPQDPYKTPVDRELILAGARGETKAVGYNNTFVYPVEGLDGMLRAMADRCHVSYGKRAVALDTSRGYVGFEDGSEVGCDRVVSTLPLHQALEMSDLDAGTTPADPYSSVLVVNIGARRGPRCPDEHWLYVPHSTSGFHRIGLYHAVDDAFLPASARGNDTHAALYVESAFRAGTRPSPEEIDRRCARIVAELQDWGMIAAVDVVSPTWVEVAYTWRRPDSDWRDDAMRRLLERGVLQTGRYGKWQFQGIADSILDGRRARSDDGE